MKSQEPFCKLSDPIVHDQKLVESLRNRTVKFPQRVSKKLLTMNNGSGNDKNGNVEASLKAFTVRDDGGNGDLKQREILVEMERSRKTQRMSWKLFKRERYRLEKALDTIHEYKASTHFLPAASYLSFLIRNVCLHFKMFY